MLLIILLKTSPLRRLQEQTLLDATPPKGKIHPISIIAVTFEPMMQFVCPLILKIVCNLCSTVYFMIGTNISNHLGLAALRLFTGLQITQNQIIFIFLNIIWKVCKKVFSE